MDQDIDNEAMYNEMCKKALRCMCGQLYEWCWNAMIFLWQVIQKVVFRPLFWFGRLLFANDISNDDYSLGRPFQDLFWWMGPALFFASLDVIKITPLASRIRAIVTFPWNEQGSKMNKVWFMGLFYLSHGGLMLLGLWCDKWYQWYHSWISGIFLTFGLLVLSSLIYASLSNFINEREELWIFAKATREVDALRRQAHHQTCCLWILLDEISRLLEFLLWCLVYLFRMPGQAASRLTMVAFWRRKALQLRETPCCIWFLSNRWCFRNSSSSSSPKKGQVPRESQGYDILKQEKIQDYGSCWKFVYYNDQDWKIKKWADEEEEIYFRHELNRRAGKTIASDGRWYSTNMKQQRPLLGEDHSNNSSYPRPSAPLPPSHVVFFEYDTEFEPGSQCYQQYYNQYCTFLQQEGQPNQSDLPR